MKIFLFCLFAATVAFGSSICADCQENYTEIDAHLTSIDTQLQVAQSKISLLQQQENTCNNYLIVALASIQNDPNAQNYIAQASQALDNMSMTLNQLSSSVFTARQNVSYLSGRLNSYECHCSVPGDCPCVEYLASINDSVINLEMQSFSLVYYIESLDTSLSTLISEIEDDVDWLKDRLGRFDDDYYSDLMSFNQSLIPRFLDLSISIDSVSFFTSRFPNQTPSYDLPNELLALSSIAGSSTLASQSAYDSAISLRYIASNINVSALSELAFISNYLDKVQRRYYEAYNRTFIPNQTNPFQPPFYSSVTNFFGNPNALTYLNYSFSNGSGKVTNWFQRIEFALYGIMGLFDDKNHDTKLDENLASESASQNYIESLTNSFNQLAQVSSVSNTLNGFISRFRSTVTKFALSPGSSSDVGFTIIPSFSIGGIEIQSLVLPFDSLSGVTDFCRSLFKVIWYAIFLVIAFRLICKMIYLAITTITHVIVIVKTLL